MPLFRPAVLSPTQIERRKRILAKGRKHYIFYRGILGWGISMSVLSTPWSWHEENGWHIPPRGCLFFIILGLVIWPVAGYFWGAYMWKWRYEEPPA